MHAIIDGVIFNQAHGGVARLWREIIPRMCLQDASLQVKLFKTRQPELFTLDGGQIEEIYLSSASGNRQPRLARDIYFGLHRYWTIRRAVRKLASPIWHSTYFTTAGKWPGPLVVTVYDMIYERFPELLKNPWDEQFRQQKRKCIEQADAIICISETTKNELEYYYSKPYPARVIPIGYSPVFEKLDPGQPSADLCIRTSKPFILYVGGRTQYKNFMVVLQAYSRWAHRHEIDLVVVGGPWSPEEKALLTELNISDRVILLTGSNDAELCRLYNQAVAFIYPSLFEGFGIPLLEAMACGCPIVASHIPSTLEVAQDCPWYFEPQAVDDLVEKLDLVLDREKSQSKMARGFEIARRYSWDRTARETLDLYHSLVSART